MLTWRNGDLVKLAPDGPAIIDEVPAGRLYKDGALLIVAPKERKVRIEVGYGLEPVLTDAASSTIVQGIILPAFRAGNMEQGILDGTQAMLSVLGGKGIPSAEPQADQLSGIDTVLLLLFIFGFIWFFPLLYIF
mgnify:CR=1 FL=1